MTQLHRLAHPSADGRHTRVIDRLVHHGSPKSFDEVALSAVPADARYLVMDLDRTIHLGRNIGELVGWEYCARMAYGADKLALAEPRRSRGRFFLDVQRPLATLHYLYLGARLWAYPGLYYLLWGKLTAGSQKRGRKAYRRFGPHPIQEVQAVPQAALLQQLSSLPLDTIRELARAVWRRHEPDQVITRESLDKLRARCPQLKIILSSASPLPVIEVAAEALGVDDFFGTEVEHTEGRLSAPLPPQPPLVLTPRRPHRFSPPSRYRTNASYGKIRHLLERYPDIFDDGVVSVGVSDNGYNEDGAFADFFTHVLDVNSTSPFFPVVAAVAPVREIHSAALLTRREQALRAAGEVAFVDERRKTAHAGERRDFTRAQLEAALQTVLPAIEERAGRFGLRAQQVTPLQDEVRSAAARVVEKLEAAVASYNQAVGDAKRAALRHLKGQLEGLGSLRRKLAELEQPLADEAYELARLLNESRLLVQTVAL